MIFESPAEAGSDHCSAASLVTLFDTSITINRVREALVILLDAYRGPCEVAKWKASALLPTRQSPRQGFWQAEGGQLPEGAQLATNFSRLGRVSQCLRCGD